MIIVLVPPEKRHLDKNWGNYWTAFLIESVIFQLCVKCIITFLTDRPVDCLLFTRNENNRTGETLSLHTQSATHKFCDFERRKRTEFSTDICIPVRHSMMREQDCWDESASYFLGYNRNLILGRVIRVILFKRQISWFYSTYQRKGILSKEWDWK